MWKTCRNNPCDNRIGERVNEVKTDPKVIDSSGQRFLTLTGFGYFPMTFIGRLPYAMIVVGVLLLIVDARDSYGQAGITSAMIGVGAASFGPVLGYLSDRIGQKHVLLVAVIFNVTFLLLLAWLSYTNVPVWVLMLTAFCIGASTPQLSPLSRARLVNIIHRHLDGEYRNLIFRRVMSYESTADETVFVFGPVVVGVLAMLIGAWSPIVIAAAITLIFIVAFALHPTAQLGSSPGKSDTSRPAAPLKELLRFQVVVLVLAMVAVGLFFGSTLTALTAFSGDVLNDPSQAGIYYGIMGIGSAVLALSVALFPQGFTLSARLFAFSVVLALGAFIFTQAGDAPSMTFALVIAGFGIGPILVTIYSLGSVRGPYGRTNTIMTILSSAIIVGQSTAVAVVGEIAENFGYIAAFWATGAAAALVLLFAILDSVWALFRKISARK